MGVFEDIFKALTDDLKSKIAGTPVFWGENDMKNGTRLVLEFTGLNRDGLNFNLKVCGSNCFSMNQSAAVAELEHKILQLPFNKPENQKGNRVKLDGFEYYLVENKDKADRETRDTVNYTRKFELIAKMKE